VVRAMPRTFFAWDCFEYSVGVAKIGTLLGAAGGVSEGAAAGACEAEIRDRLAEHFQRF
jgi:hypothetical protein